MTELATPQAAISTRAQIGRYAAVTLIVAGVAVRIWVLLNTRGANDVKIWEMITDGVRTYGLWPAYKALPYLNHPPVAAATVMWLRDLSISLGKPFAIFLKLPCVMAELGAGFLLYRHWLRRSASLALWGVAAYMLSPLSILLSSFHGNTDSIYAAMLLACALALDADRPVLAGGIMGVTLQVKLIPLLAAPALFLSSKTRRAAGLFVVGCCVAPALYAVEALIGGTQFLGNVFGYASQPEHWGITGIFIFAGVAEGGAYFAYGRWIMTAALLLLPLALRWRSRPTAVAAGALAMVVFLTFTPGFGLQYMAAALPLLFAVSVYWGLALSCVGGAFAFMVYAHFLVPRTPIESEFLTRYPAPAAYVGVGAWLICAVVAVLLTSGKLTGAAQRS